MLSTFKYTQQLENLAPLPYISNGNYYSFWTEAIVYVHKVVGKFPVENDIYVYCLVAEKYPKSANGTRS